MPHFIVKSSRGGPGGPGTGTGGTNTRHVVALGDSITYGYLATPGSEYPTRMATVLGTNYTVRNAGVNGNTLAQMQARISNDVVPYLDSTVGNYVVVLGGINDIAGGSDGPTTYAAVVTLCTAIRAAVPAGTKIGIATMTPAYFYWNTARHSANDSIRANYTTFADFLVDFAADTRFGDDDDAANLTLYQDALHPTDLVYGYMGDDAAAALLAADADTGLQIAPGAPPATDHADDSPTGRNPRFIWTPTRQHNWNRMYANYLANPSSPTEYGGYLFKQILLAAQDGLLGAGAGQRPYGNVGQIATWLYQVTGQQAWCDEAWRQINSWIMTFAAGPATAFDPNTAREWMTMQWIMIDWLWPGLSAANRTAYLAKLEAITISINDVVYPPGYPLGDSDQVVGHYMANVMFGLNHPNNATAQRVLNQVSTGGLTATASNHSSNARNCIKHLVNDIALGGGEWIESSEYNPGTVYNLYTGYEAVKTHTGIDYFPEITAWLENGGKSVIGRWTPDLLHTAQFGDEEHPGDIVYWVWASHMMVYCGVAESTTQGPRVFDLFRDLSDLHGDAWNDASGFHPRVYWRGIFFFNPYMSRGDWQLNNKTFYDPGNGLVWQKSGFTSADTLTHIHLWPMPQDPDPITDEGSMWPNGGHMHTGMGDFTVYKNGEWVINHPIGWASPASSWFGEGTNTPLIHGMNAAWEYKKTRAVTTTDAYVYACITNGGSFMEKYIHNGGFRPPVILHESTRSILAVHGSPYTMIIYDRINADDINAADYIYQYYEFITKIKTARKQVVFHKYTDPTIVGNVVTTTTPNGVAVKQTVLSPTLGGSTDIIKYNEVAEFVNTDPQHFGWWGFFGAPQGYPTNIRYEIQVRSNSKWDTFANVIQVGTAGTHTLISDGTKAQGIHVTTGANDILAIFNSTQAADLNTNSYHASHSAALDVAHLHLAKTFTIAWTATTTTDVYLQDLRTTLVWTTNVDGAGAVTRTPDSGGHFKFSVSGAGAHSITVVGT